MITNKDTLLKLEKISGKKLTFANLIYAIRMGENLSQAEFGISLGVSKQYICDIEHGRRSVSIPVAGEWAKKLGYSAEQFVRLAIQDVLDKSRLKFKVYLKKAA